MPMFFHWGCRTCRVSNWTTAGRECRAQSDGLNSVYLSPSRSKHPCCTLSKDLKRRCCSIYKLYMYNFLNFLRNVLLTVACLISMYIVAGLYCYYWLHKFVMCDSTCILLVFLVGFFPISRRILLRIESGISKRMPIRSPSQIPSAERKGFWHPTAKCRLSSNSWKKSFFFSCTHSPDRDVFFLWNLDRIPFRPQVFNHKAFPRWLAFSHHRLKCVLCLQVIMKDLMTA